MGTVGKSPQSPPWVRFFGIALVLAMLLAACGGGSGADEYPSDEIEVIVPFPAGGGADIAIRTMQPVLEEALGQSIVVLNTAGGGGAIGTTEAASAEPDGYTWLLITIGPAATQPHLQDLTYTPDSFQPVTLVNNEALIVVVPPDSPFETFDDLVEASKGGDLTWAAAPTGGVPHLSGEMILQAVGGSARMVPFDGTGPAATAIAGSQIDAATIPSGTVSSQIEEGTMRALAVTSAERLPSLPDVPTVSESGYDVVVHNWNGVVLPAETPQEIVDKVHEVLTAAIESDAYQTILDNSGSPLEIVSPDGFASLWQQDYERFGDLIESLKESGALE